MTSLCHHCHSLYSRQVAAEVAAPLSQAKKITMVSSGKGDVGAAKLTNEVFEVMAKLPHVVEGMTGVDIAKVRDPVCCVTSRSVQWRMQMFTCVHYISLACQGRSEYRAIVTIEINPNFFSDCF